MKLVRFKNTSAIINLDWHALPADQSERSALKAIMEQNKGVKAGVIVKYGGVTLIGLGPTNAKVISGPSAAAWLSMANQKAQDQGNAGMPSTGSGSANDWVLIENLGDQQYWVAVIRDGVPLPGMDVVVERDLALDIAREAVETAPFVVFSPDESIRNDVPAGTIVDARGFADLVQGVKPGKAAMRAISGVPVKVLAAVAGLLVLGLLWMGYSWYAEKKKQEELAQRAAADAAMAAKQQSADKAAYAVSVKKAVIDALEKGEKDLNIALKSPSADEAIASWVGLIANVSVNQNGWAITNFECAFESDGSPSCKVNLTRQENGINRMLFQDHPDAVLEGDAASFVIKGSPTSARSGRFQDLERAKSFNLDFISDLQMLHFANVNYTITESKDVTAAVTMPPIPASIFKPGDTKQAAPAPGPVKMGVASGDLTFSGSEVWQLEGLREFLRRDNVSVKSLTVGMSDITPAQWSLAGAYHIKNAPEPVLPVIVGPDQQMIQVDLPEKYRASPEELASWQDGGTVAAGKSPDPVASPQGAAPESPDVAAPGAENAAPAPMVAPVPEAPPPPPPPQG